MIYYNGFSMQLKEGFCLSGQSTSLKKKAFGGFIWTFGERIGAQLVSLVVSIILARLLLPSDYAIVGVVTIFFNFANVIVAGGLNTALIQKKDSTAEDYSTILYTSLAVSVIIYVVLFFTAPLIAKAYEMPLIVPVIRIMALMVIINAVKSILTAYIANTLQFKKMFIATMAATLISAAIGISMALMGFGVWALVAQQMFNSIASTAALFITTKWKPIAVFSVKSFKELFGFGWKIFATSVISTIYDEINPIIVGLKFSAVDLSFYTKGKNFPSLLNGTINQTLSTVLFPVMSKVQDDISAVLSITRRYIRVATYVIFPLMCGFFAVSESFVRLLLTEKWMGAVPYVQIFCISYMFDMIQVGNLQTIKAIGRSDISLILEIIKKSSYFVIILVFIFVSNSPVMLAVSAICCTVVATIINTFPNRKLIGYKYRYQIADIAPNLIISLIMGAVVLLMNKLTVAPILLLPLQVVTGAVIYIGLSLLTRNENFKYLLKTGKQFLKRG